MSDGFLNRIDRDPVTTCVRSCGKAEGSLSYHVFVGFFLLDRLGLFLGGFGSSGSSSRCGGSESLRVGKILLDLENGFEYACLRAIQNKLTFSEPSKV